MPLHTAEETADQSRPGHGREFIDGGDDEARQPAIERFIDRDDGRCAVAAEVTVAIDAANLQVGGVIACGNQLEGCRFELGAAPGTLFERNGRGFALVVPVLDGPAARGVAIVLVLAAPLVGGRGASAPEPDFEGPVAKLGVVFAFELQGADQGGRAAELVERQEPERVTHQHADARAGNARIAQTPQQQGEGRKPEIGFRLAATGGKNSRSTVSRSLEPAGSTIPGRFISRKASWKGRQRGTMTVGCLSDARRCAAVAMARLAS